MKIGIYGYGNLGKGVELAIRQNADMELMGVFTRRPPESLSLLTEGVPVYAADRILEFKDSVDVLVICGGSATDLPQMTPQLAQNFHVVDSFDTHAAINTHFSAVDEAAKESGHVALISAGWDPGLFSLNRVYASAVLPNGVDYTFWGKGVSQGHSDAIRRIDGVKDARQYTVPCEKALTAVRNGEAPTLTTGDKHTRECFVVVEEGADKEKIAEQIKRMPNYFADYHTTVTFVTEEELKANHSGLPHGGVVLCGGTTGADNEHRQLIEYRLQLDSNPEFTANVLAAYARAVYRLAQRGESGCRTVLDIAPSDLSPLSSEALRAKML